MTQSHYQSILDLARHSANGRSLTLPDGLRIRREYGQLVFRAKRRCTSDADDQENATIRIPGTTTFTGQRIEASVLSSAEVAAINIKGDKSPFLEYLDLDRVGQPLVVRRRRPGDCFTPLGLSGSKKLGKFLTAARVPEAVRETVLVFEGQRKIAWVCPVRISEHARVTSNTQRVLRLNVSG